MHNAPCGDGVECHDEQHSDGLGGGGEHGERRPEYVAHHETIADGSEPRRDDAHAGDGDDYRHAQAAVSLE